MTTLITESTQLRHLSVDQGSILNEAQLSNSIFALKDLDLIFGGIDWVNKAIIAMVKELKLKQWYWSNFTVGITDNIEVRFSAHGVTEHNYWKEIGDEEVCRAIERYYTNFKKTSGASGGGGTARYLYVFYNKLN